MINIIDWLITHFFDLLSFFITLFKKEDSKEERRVYKELMRKSKSAYDIILHETVFFGDVLLRLGAFLAHFEKDEQ